MTLTFIVQRCPPRLYVQCGAMRQPIWCPSVQRNPVDRDFSPDTCMCTRWRRRQSPRNVKQGMGVQEPHCSPPLGSQVPGLFAGSAGSHADWQVSLPLTRSQASCSLFAPCFPLARMLLLPSLPFILSSSDYNFYKNPYRGASLVVQWLRICLAVQGTRVQFLAGNLRCHRLQGN